MNNNTVIVYRSQGEANMDWFLNECLFPWIYNHGWYILGTIFVLGVLFYIKVKFVDRNKFWH